jgi:hypothetical protein
MDDAPDPYDDFQGNGKADKRNGYVGRVRSGLDFQVVHP